MWFVFAFSCAFFDSLKDVVGKSALQKADFSPYMVSWGLTFFGAFFLSPLLLITGIPTVNSAVFWPSLLIGSFLNVFALSNYFKAIKIADMSLATPIAAFTPLFLIVISPIVTFLSGGDAAREIPTPLGMGGVIFIVSGTYILNIKERRKGYLAPLKAVFEQKGSRLVLISAFLWSVTISFDKIGLTSITSQSSFQRSIFWGCCIMLTISIFTLFFMLLEKNKERKRNIYSKHSTIDNAAQTKKSNLPLWLRFINLMAVGLSDALITIFHMLALSTAIAAYAIAVKRLSIVFKVLWAALLFKEKALNERLVGACIMVIGVICITLANSGHLVVFFDNLLKYLI
jgi:drug/metabolite transporter (DMT)-like permease